MDDSNGWRYGCDDFDGWNGVEWQQQLFTSTIYLHLRIYIIYNIDDCVSGCRQIEPLLGVYFMRYE